MSSVARFFVKHNRAVFCVVLALAVICGILITQVKVNSDMTKYLPSDSETKTGAAIMKDEFAPASTFNLLFKDLTDADKAAIPDRLTAMQHVTSVSYDETERYNNGEYTLYIATLDVSSYTDESNAVIKAVKSEFKGYDLTLNGDAAGNMAAEIMPKLSLIAVGLGVIVLLFMCNSWIEPPLYLFTIGVAILLNMGTNVIFGEIASVTNAIAAILQLCLSMDYSIMMMNRYKQEKLLCDDKKEAMRKALKGAFQAVLGSSVTTIVGMLALLFMSFTLGRDLGLVLAKGVFFSLLCNFTVLPALLLMFNGLLSKTAKPSLHIKMGAIGSYSYKLRFVIPFVLLGLFVVSFFIRDSVSINYSMEEYYKVNEVFTVNNPIVVIYENKDEDKVAALTGKWEQATGVTAVNSYGSTLGKSMNAAQLAAVIDNPALPEATVTLLLGMYWQAQGTEAQETVPLYDFMVYLATDVAENPMFAAFISDELKTQLDSAISQLDAAKSAFVGANYSRVIFSTDLPEESEETFAFIRTLKADLKSAGVTSYVAGNSAMAYEMSESFPSEQNKITILTVVAIFIVVALAFRSLSVPLILVLVIQCAVFVTMSISYVRGASLYYLPLLIVQCLLLGATVDYGILLTSYYRESRRTMERRDAIKNALNQSIHTIMTSGLILVIVTAVMGGSMGSSDPAISEILLTISLGAACALILVVFILPGVLVALDKIVTRRDDRVENRVISAE